MQVTTVPASRFAWRGQTVTYVVRADGASEVRLPEERVQGLEARLTRTDRVGNGVEARLAIAVRDGGMA